MLEKMKAIKNGCKIFFQKDWTVQEKVLVMLNCALLGVILGVLFGPRKGAFALGSYNGNQLQEDCWEEEGWIDEED